MPSRRKKQKLIRFEISLMGLVGIGVVCFCIFLWMFLLGIWAGQTILVSAAGPAGQVWHPGFETALSSMPLC